MEVQYNLQKRKIAEQERLIDSIVMSEKTPNPSFANLGDHDSIMQKASEEA